VELWEVVRKAKSMWLGTMYKVHHDINRVAEEAAKVGSKEGVEAGRRTLVEGLRHLFEEREQEAFNADRREEALAIAVASHLLLGIVNSPREWLSLLVGDGVIDVAAGRWASQPNTPRWLRQSFASWPCGLARIKRKLRVKENGVAVFASAKDMAKVLRALLVSDVLEYGTALAKSWSGLAGPNAPRLILLLALAQLLGVVEGKWAVELWLAHKVATTPTPLEVFKVLEDLFTRLKGVDKVEWSERGVSVYFRLQGVEGVSRAVTLRLYTNLATSTSTANRVVGLRRRGSLAWWQMSCARQWSS